MLHLAAFISLDKTEPIKQDSIEITVESKGDSDTNQITSDIIPKEEDGNSEEIPSDKGYYGIGITSRDHFVDGRFVVEILMVSFGYPADLAGLQSGDIIIEVNGMPITTGQEIKGEGKTSLTLKVKKRNGMITFMRLTRDFIRTEN
jgi:C-terminal processing protease CtpA/Prc